MKNILEKYYNLLYYCEYTLLFFILKRILNPFYWIGILRWNNKYLKNIVSRIKKQEISEIHGGVNIYISSWATFAINITSCWLFVILLIGGIILKINIPKTILENEFMILLLLIVFVSYIYYMAHFFVFKNDKYKSYFKEFESKKRYLLYYSIYTFSIIIQFVTFYVFLKIYYT